ncbi:hypothetical protein FUAX_18160 [Fulvitalea axinellae]|uniref:Uncharacterized protein n=1 Tax=Fulvitalea axinellae TaxID=1182444 RepID=A0AAU9CSG5_9BACT|nr:hypothetical protein FUAX_18160 [Fulvitalea axinellae]
MKGLIPVLVFFILVPVFCAGQKVGGFPVIEGLDTRGFKERVAWVPERVECRYLYIGKLQDSIRVGNDLSPYWNSKIMSDYLCYESDSVDRRLSALGYWEWTKLEVLVDTTQRILVKKERGFTIDKYYLAYPVLIVNQNSIPVNIGVPEYLDLSVEARDLDGHWKTLARPFNFFCLSGASMVHLPPGEVVLGNALIFSGATMTSLRVRFGNSVSESFWGSVNLGQLTDSAPFNYFYDGRAWSYPELASRHFYW